MLYTHAGPEVAVASTKAFLTQLVACYLVALYLGQVRGTQWGDEVRAVIRDLARIAEDVERVLETMEPVRELARSLAGHDTVLFLGRHVGYPVALEGALKLKELAYMHAEGFAAGELKHGPIALVEEACRSSWWRRRRAGGPSSTARSCRTSRRSGRAGPAPSSSRRRATRRSCRTRTT